MRYCSDWQHSVYFGSHNIFVFVITCMLRSANFYWTRIKNRRENWLQIRKSAITTLSMLRKAYSNEAMGRMRCFIIVRTFLADDEWFSRPATSTIPGNVILCIDNSSSQSQNTNREFIARFEAFACEHSGKEICTALRVELLTTTTSLLIELPPLVSFVPKTTVSQVLTFVEFYVLPYKKR